MKKTGIAIVLALFFSAVAGAAGYKILSVAAEVTPEAVMPQDMSIVISIDHSDPDQVKLLNEIIARVPSLGLMDELISEYDDSAPSPFKYSENKALIDGGWQFVFGVKLPGDSGKLMELLDSPDITLDSSGIEIYAVAKFSDPDRIQLLLNEIAKESNGDMQFIGNETNILWRIKQGKGNVLIVRHQDVYFMVSSLAQRATVLQRIKDGTGFDQSPDYQANMKLLGEKNLGYVFVNGELVVDAWKDLLASIQVGMPTEMMDIIADIWGVALVDGSGFKVVSKVYFGGDQSLWAKYYPAYELSLIKKIPSQGVFVYAEMPSLGFYLEEFFKGVAAGFGSSSIGGLIGGNTVSDYDYYDYDYDDSYEYDDIYLTDESDLASDSNERVSREKAGTALGVADNPANLIEAEESSLESTLVKTSLYEEILDQLAVLSGLTKDDIRKIFDNPYAISISDISGYVPAISFYVQLDSLSVENAKKLVASAATYVDQILAELDGELKYEGLDGIIKKEVVEMSGAAMQKIFVDWSSLSADKLTELNNEAGMDVSTVKLEIYYGVLSDGMFVFALYPNFADAYGQESIADAGYYKEMISSVAGVYGRSVSFFRMSPVLDLAGRYFELMKIVGAISATDTETELYYEMYGAVASAFKYLFASEIKDSDGVRSSTSLKIDKVEFSPELTQKIEAQKAEQAAAREAERKAYEEWMKEYEGTDFSEYDVLE